MISIQELINMDLDIIPKYLIMRDLLRLNKDNEELVVTKKELLGTKWVNDIVKHQWDDGSWGRFHSMATSSKLKITTESALRRLLILGLDKNDKPIQKALSYMEKYLKREIDLRDYKEKKHDWDLLTRLFVATWILLIDPTNIQARRIAKKWSKVITYAFSGDTYNYKWYKDAYYDIHRPEEGKVVWGFENYYLIAMLPGFLNQETESKFLDYIINYEKGIYYIYDEKLMNPPTTITSKQASRYIHAHELLSRFPLAKYKSEHFTKFINDNILDDGFWDMGQSVKEQTHYPISDSWRKAINRKIDCTIRIKRVLSNLS